MKKYRKTGLPRNSFCIRWIMFALILAAVPSVPVRAEDLVEWEVIVSRNLNMDGKIAGITRPENGNDQGHKWKGSKVCFGRWGKYAVTYRVLDPMTTAYSGGDTDVRTMLLDCTVSLCKLPYMETVDAEPQWEGSYVRSWLNGAEFLYNEECFTEPERDAMTESVKPEPLESDSARVSVTRAGSSRYRYLQFTPLAGDRIFLLDAGELTNAEYGYHSAAADIDFLYTDIEWTNKAKALFEDGFYSKQTYWVRTNRMEERVYFKVDADGKIVEAIPNRTEESVEYVTESDTLAACNKYGNFITGFSGKDSKGVSPAMNLNLSHILFAGSDKEDCIYLTLKNGTAVTKAESGNAGGICMGAEGGFVSLKNICMEGKYQLEPDGLWAMVADEEGRVYSCERIADAVQGESFVRIKEGLLPGKYRLYVFYGTKGFPTSYACMDLDEWMELTITDNEAVSGPPYYIYLVKEGDSLWRIADRFCGDFFDREIGDPADRNEMLCEYVAYLWAANRDVVKNPDHIEPGMELKLYETAEMPAEDVGLLTVMEKAAGNRMESYVCVDMDHDGAKEMIGVVYADSCGSYQTWYCSSDGTDCRLVNQNSRGVDSCRLELLEVGEETHVAVNGFPLTGPSKNHTILALEKGEISCLVSDRCGAVYMSEEGDIILTVDAYDAAYDTSFGETGHTWKDTYLYFDGKGYKEYGAADISEEEYLAYENAREIKAQIEQEINPSKEGRIEYRYFRRSNGIIHIQCDVHWDNGSIDYQYYTVRFEENALYGETGVMNSGRMTNFFSDLDVTY